MKGRGCPWGGAQPPQLPVLFCLWRSLPAQVGRAFLSCGNSSMVQHGLRLAAVVFRNILQHCERQGNQALSALVKDFESKLFCSSYPVIRALNRKETLGQSSHLAFGRSVLISVGFTLAWDTENMSAEPVLHRDFQLSSSHDGGRKRWCKAG